MTPTLSGGATIAGDSVAAAQLLFGVSVLPPWSNRLPLDVGAIVAFYGLTSGDRAQARAAYIRQHYLTEHGGYWAGAALAQTDRSASAASNAIDVGAWLRKGPFRFTGDVSTARTSDRTLFNGTSLVASDVATSVRVVDVTLGAGYSGGRLEGDASITHRTGREGLNGTSTRASLSLTWLLRGRMRAVFSTGSQVADPLRGTPEWRFVSVGLRVSNAPPPSFVARGKAGPTLGVRRLADGRVHIVIGAPASADRVEISGTFTDWQPVALEHGSDGWFVNMNAPAGLHRVQVRVNGGDWRVPSNLAAVDDEFGQRAGIVVFP